MDDEMREAIEELAWLKKSAVDEKDHARIVGYEDCLRKWQAALASLPRMTEGDLGTAMKDIHELAIWHSKSGVSPSFISDCRALIAKLPHIVKE